MKHYVCKGECNGVSDKPGVCNSESCSKYKHPLVKCNCKDGEHLENN